MNSLPTPMPACTVLKLNSRCMPRNQARNETPMNRPILTLRTGTPTARALAGLPPAAKIQLPTLVRSRSHVPTATNASHHSTVTLTVMTPRSRSEAKIALADENPSSWLASEDATAPVTSLVTPRLRPWRMKKVLSVTRKLGIPVRTTSQPLMNPMASATTRLSTTPTHMLRLSWKHRIEANNAVVVTWTPDDRSNSPPIIRRATPTATMPIVELAYR